MTKVFLLAFSAIMMSTGVFAQKSLKTFDIKDLTASLFSTTEEIVTAMKESKEKKAFYEDDILLEEWMTDLDYWAKSMDSSSIEKGKSAKPMIPGEETEIIEESLEIEEWMLDYNWIEKEDFEEEELKLEDWMQNPENWNIYACK
jgi:hypothetical protein